MHRPIRPARRALAALAALTTAALATGFAIPPADAPGHVAKSLERRARFTAAVERYLAAGERVDEDGTRALMDAARLLERELGEPARAIALYRRVLARAPARPIEERARYRLGVLLVEAGELGPAREALAPLVAPGPDGRVSQTPEAQDGAMYFDWIDRRVRTDDAGVGAPAPAVELRREVRVRIVAAAAEATVAVRPSASDGAEDARGRSALIAHAGGRSLAAPGLRFERRGESIVAADPAGADLAFGPGPVDVEPRAGVVAVEGTRFRGRLRIHLNEEQGGLDVVNLVDVEDYIRGVLPREIPAGWPDEALRAQAIVSRTFALFHALRDRGRHFDLHATVMSQVYGGMDVEQATTDAAVAWTRGRYLVWKGRPAFTTFHSNSGGYTVEHRAIWEVPYPYLNAVEDPYSREMPGDAWELVLTSREIEDALAAQDRPIGPLRAIELTRRAPDGHNATIRFVHEGGALEVPSHDFRHWLGTTRLKSTRFEVRRSGDDWHFAGHGYGHGVGMSQWGAYRMASEGRSHREILSFFYGGLPLRLAWR